MARQIKAMIIDDSAVVRETMKSILESAADIEVVATAADPLIATKKLQHTEATVLTLDIEMPRMDGLSFLKKLMSEQPVPVVICSSQAESGSQNAIRALEYGAVDIVEKPKLSTKKFLEESRTRICDVVRAAHNSRPRSAAAGQDTPAPPAKLNADAVLRRPSGSAVIETTDRIVVVGASTGGTEALRLFLEGLPLDAPGIVIVQHMPEHFTAAFAKRLDTLCRVTVKEAQDNDTVIRGRVLIAPGNKHCLVKSSGARYYVEIKDGPLVSRHRPSVDVLFRSAARYAGKNAIGVIMTGMGDDGARGMAELRAEGAYTIAQDEESCVVFGMPKEAMKRGGVMKVLPLSAIAQQAIRVATETAF